MRVIQVTPTYLPAMGGVQNHVREVAPRLAAAGIEVTILTTDVTDTLPREEEVEGVRIVRVRAWPQGTDLYLAPALRKVIAGQGWDVVHVQGVHTLVPPMAMASALLAGRPYVISLHTGGHRSMIRTQLRDMQWIALRPLLRRAHRIIGVSRYEADHFRRLLRLPSGQFTVIPNGAGFAQQAPDGGDTGRSNGFAAPLLVSIGRLERYKGHHRVIQALPHLLARWPDAHLLVLGDGPYRADLMRIAVWSGVADRVEFRVIPPHHREEMAAALAGADVVALLSDYEAHPLAIMEALSVGRRVLVTDDTGLHDLVEDGLAAGIEPGSASSTIAAAIDGILGGSTIASAPVGLPTWDACAARLAEVYREAAGG